METSKILDYKKILASTDQHEVVFIELDLVRSILPEV